jgi:hypothetical protein
VRTTACLERRSRSAAFSMRASSMRLSITRARPARSRHRHGGWGRLNAFRFA